MEHRPASSFRAQKLAAPSCRAPPLERTTSQVSLRGLCRDGHEYGNLWGFGHVRRIFSVLDNAHHLNAPALFCPKVATGIFGMAAYSVSKRLMNWEFAWPWEHDTRKCCRQRLGVHSSYWQSARRVGLGLGILATRILAFIVYQATPRDPVVLTGVVLAMALLGLVATWIPAQRALSVNPLILLREE